MTKIKNHNILCIRVCIICIDGQCRKNYQYMVLSGLKIHLNSAKTSYKNYNEDSDIEELF